MFASYEVATSFPSLTAIKGYHLDKSSDVPFNGTLKAFVANQNSKRVEDFAVKGVPLQDLDSTLREKQIPPFCSPQLRND